MIKNKSYIIDSQLLNKGLLSTFIAKFWDEVFSPLVTKGAEKHLLVLVKASFVEVSVETSLRTMGYLRSVNYSDKELYTEYLTERLSYLNESYTTTPINKLNLSYIERGGLAPEDGKRLLQDVTEDKLAFHRFNNLILPISMNVAEYGTIRATTKFDTFTRFIVNSGKRNYEIDVSLDGLINKVTILGVINLSWVDTLISKESGLFKREIGKSTKYFLDGVNVLNKQVIPSKAFKLTKADSKKVSSFVTIDIETINKEGNQIPYLICGYNGSNFITSYADSTLDQTSLFSNFIEKLLLKSFSGIGKIKVYAHNLSGFDGIFLMKQLLPFGEVKPLLFNGKLISITLVTPTGKTLVFKDSYLLLPLSLRRLSAAFKVEMAKSYFPFNLTNINYTGVFPSFDLWTGIDLTAYDSLKLEYGKRMWSFKDEAIKYCKLDCQVLHMVLSKFNDLIFSNFQLNIHHVLTLPSLAMKIFKTHFLSKNTIYRLSGEVEANIRQSYSGGAVDVYIPHNRIGSYYISAAKAVFRRLFYYDVNSLYPTVMSSMPMPIGKPIAFEGDIRKYEPEAFGIFHCNITSPEYLKHPILQRKIRGKGTVAGLGSWNGWISSIEMDNAIKFGYQFTIIKGYQFEKGDLFSAYVNRLYGLRMQYPKGDPMNLIAKLLLNSLYGKFGMRANKTITEIYNLNTDAGKLALKKLLDSEASGVQDFIEFDNNKYLFLRDSLSNILSVATPEEDSYHGSEVNVAIASTITASARVYMSQFKNNPNFNLYYSDTDSIVIDNDLNNKFVGKGLGLLKLEYEIKRAVFLAPKVYGLVDTEGNEIIKVKGITENISSDIHVNDLEYLLIEDTNKVFNQEKWYKSLVKGEIKVSDVLYNLKVTSNKREVVYVDNIFSKTEPLNYNYKI